jgi:hypothetical protein
LGCVYRIHFADGSGGKMKVMKDTEIHRRTKKEALQAIKDLIERDFIITYPLTEIKSTSIGRGEYNYHKSKFYMGPGNVSSCWYARMRKVQ